MYKMCRVVVLVVLGHLTEHFLLLLVGDVRFGDDVEDVLIRGFF